MKLLRMFLTLCLCLPATAMATYIEPDPLRNEFSSVAAADAEAVKKFDVRFALSTHHANERYRLYAQTAAADGRLNDAAKFFRIAATYADKYSQLRLSMLYWHGVGVPQDRVEAYIWADLAAERGYPQFLAVREQMWRELTPDQQASAALRGPALYVQFGDAVAKQRFRSKLARSATRAHAKRIGGIQVLPGKTLRRGVVASREEEEAWSLAYSPSRVDPEMYWAIEDRIMTRGLSSTVTVGDIEETARAKPEYYQFKFKARTPEQPKREESEQEQPEQE
jgi:uncharacterized protein